MQCFSDTSIPFILFFGSLLGFVREKDFIVNDDDVDVLAERKDRIRILEILTDAKFKFVSKSPDFIQIETEYGPFDFYFYDAVGTQIRIPWEHIFVKRDHVFPAELVEYFGFNVYVPKNRLDTMKRLYGDKWMIPRSKYS
jgi:lipopolysaccharide cholinephosphotransferase